MSARASIRFSDDTGRETAVSVDGSGVLVGGGKGVKIVYPFAVSMDGFRVSPPVASFVRKDGITVIVDGSICHTEKKRSVVEIRVEREKNGGVWFKKEQLPRLRISVVADENKDGNGETGIRLNVSVLGGDLDSEILVASVLLGKQDSK